jgi:hypothetical protein
MVKHFMSDYFTRDKYLPKNRAPEPIFFITTVRYSEKSGIFLEEAMDKNTGENLQGPAIGLALPRFLL